MRCEAGSLQGIFSGASDTEGAVQDLATFPGAHDVVWEQMEEVWRDQLVQLHQRICESDDQLKTNTED